MRRQVDTGHLHAPRQQNTDHWDMGDGQPPVSVWFDLSHAGMGARCTLSPPPLQVLVSEEGTCPPRIPLVALSPQPVSLDHQYLLVRSAKLMAYYTTNRRWRPKGSRDLPGLTAEPRGASLPHSSLCRWTHPVPL